MQKKKQNEDFIQVSLTAVNMNNQKPLKDVVISRILRNIAIAAIIAIIFFCFPAYVSGDCGHEHGDPGPHHHDHIEEPASFKWTRQANEEHLHHEHEHTDDHGHGHEHHQHEHHEHIHHTGEEKIRNSRGKYESIRRKIDDY